MKLIFLENNKGFTLIETLVAIGIFMVMMSAVSVFYITLYRQQTTDMVMIERSAIASRAIEIMSGEIRKINRGENGAFHLNMTTGQTFSFFSDVDEDGETEKITYYLDGSELKRSVVEPGYNNNYNSDPEISVLCTNVQNGSSSIFEYYNETYTGSEEPMSSPVETVNVSLVGINLYINIDNDYIIEPLYVDTKVQIRNLK